MKTHLDISHAGTLGDERTRMTFDQDSVAHLMSVLTDLYSDPAMAVIREYSTNALDSHVAAGNPAPIEVELPTSLRPIFVVRDHGLGMSMDTLTNQFSKYGWSSKRETDEAVGMLGLGCKAGLSYTSQFTLVSVHDGLQITALVTRESDGAGAVQIIDTAATELPNGVEVQVPVSYASDFNRKAERFFLAWEPGTVLVNTVEPKHYGDLEGDLVIGKDMVMTKAESDIIIMGNVPYPVKSDHRVFRHHHSYSSNNYSVVVRVPIGAVNFTPSREALHYTKRTLAVIDTQKTRVKLALLRAAQADVSAASTNSEAMQRMLKWEAVISRSRLRFGGVTFPHDIRFSDPDRTYGWQATRRGGNKSYQMKTASLKEALAAVHVVGYTGQAARIAGGVALILGGLALGIYLGIVVCLVGGIVQVVHGATATPVAAGNIAWGVARVMFAGLTGIVSGAVFMVPGAALVASAG